MAKRFVVVWFYQLTIDWFVLRNPAVSQLPFVLTTPSHGRSVITAANALARSQGIEAGMVLADARAVIPSLKDFDDKPQLAERLLQRLAEWCIRFTPFVAVDPPNGLILDATGCSHLWGGDEKYLSVIHNRLQSHGYHLRISVADTIGAAWAVAHFDVTTAVVESGRQMQALQVLPPASIRLDMEVIERLNKLGIRKVEDFMHMPRSALRRRFGPVLLMKLDQALGNEEEIIQPVEPVSLYQERLPCLDPVVTAAGIEMALQQLLAALCQRLQQEQKGIRKLSFKCYRVDGKIIEIGIGTNRPSRNTRHLSKLFEMKLANIEPALGIELFVLIAQQVEDQIPVQEKLWESKGGMEDERISELIDRLTGKFGAAQIRRYLPAEHYWPERSFKPASHLNETANTDWRADRPRPLQLLSIPERILVTAPIPDYPPMLFRHKGKLHKIIKADGPERIEQEWWLHEGEHRDYYRVEDEDGCRYWLYRSGHYDAEKTHQWFIHGFFA
jgi:protein ImuB